MTGIREPGVGPTWGERAKLPGLGPVLDPADPTGTKNALIDRLHREALGCIDRGAGRRILDFGCGTGRLSDWLREQGADVLGVDASPEMIEVARTRFPSARFEVLESGGISVDDGAFDTVLSVGVLQYFVMDAAELATVSLELARVLASDGQLVCIEQVQYGELERGGTLQAYREGFAVAGLRTTHSAVRVSSSRIISGAMRWHVVAALPGLERLVRFEAGLARPDALVDGRYADYLFVSSR